MWQTATLGRLGARRMDPACRGNRALPWLEVVHAHAELDRAALRIRRSTHETAKAEEAVARRDEAEEELLEVKRAEGKRDACVVRRRDDYPAGQPPRGAASSAAVSSATQSTAASSPSAWRSWEFEYPLLFWRLAMDAALRGYDNSHIAPQALFALRTAVPLTTLLHVESLDADLAALAACRPQIETFKQLSLNAQRPDLAAKDIAEAFLVYVYSRTSDGQVRGRMFDPLHGIPEDPATGSAAGALAGLLADQDHVQGEAQYTISQGEEMGRPSRITVDVVRDKGQIRQTHITGCCVEVIQGTFLLPI